MTQRSLYYTWVAMRQRCNNPRSQSFKWYGGRGIRVCPQWDDFAVFSADVGARPSPKHSIDRIDVNGNYEPGNVRWATLSEQRHNTRGTWRPAGQTAFGRTQTYHEWAAEFGIPKNAIANRVSRGMTLEEALTKPIQKRGLMKRPPDDVDELIARLCAQANELTGDGQTPNPYAKTMREAAHALEAFHQQGMKK